MPKKYIRPLTDLETKFVEEAEAAWFAVDYTEDGAPYAMGADHNAHCFSMNVEEHAEREPGCSSYTLKS